MSEPFVGEIRMFGGDFAPRGWALCDGQLLATSQNDALFSLLGTIYGGDGRTTFGLPELRGRLPMHQGHGPGLSDRRIGAKGGQERVTLIADQVGAHTHSRSASSADGTTQDPTDGVPATPASGVAQYAASGSGATDPVAPAGGSQSHENMSPFQAVNFIIALVGIYPSRS